MGSGYPPPVNIFPYTYPRDCSLWIIPFPLHTVQEIIRGNYPGNLPGEITGGGNVQYSLLPLMLLLLRRRHDVKSKARQILRSKQTFKKLIPTFGHQGIIVKQNLLNESIQTAYFMALEHSALHSKPIVGRRLFHIRQNPRPALRELREVQGAPAPGPQFLGLQFAGSGKFLYLLYNKFMNKCCSRNKQDMLTNSHIQAYLLMPTH